VSSAAAPVDADAARLRELGYPQELERRLRLVDNAALGFAAISPVVGLYAVVLVGTTVAGPAWVWVLPVALTGQCLLLAVYSELASEFPIAGGAYQWTRRLVGPAYGWFAGWVAVCAYAVANTTIAYLGAPWALTLLEIEPTANALVLMGMVLVVICALVGALGIRPLSWAVKAGVTAEVVASVGIGLALLLVFREQNVSILTESLGAEALSGGSTAAGMLAALAVGGWVFIGFDACVSASEETRSAGRHVPRAIWVALLSVGALVILNAVAATLAHPNPAAIVAGEDLDPISTAVVSSFGSWSAKPFAAVVLVAFLACGMAAQGLTARTIYSIARDGVLPGSRVLRRVDSRRSPLPAVALTALIACLGLLLGLSSAAVGSLITFGTAAIYVAFLLIALAALTARVRGRWRPAGRVRLGRAGLAINALAVAWLGFETVNIAWPRDSLAPPGAPWYQVWAAPLVLALIAGVGLAYLVVARPQRRPRATPARPSENVEIVRRSLEAFGSGDFDTAFAAHDADAEWHTAADEPDSQVYRGIAALDRFVDSLGEAWEDRFAGVMEFEDFIERGDWVIVPWSARLRGRGSGIAVDVRETYAVQVRDARIVRVEEYRDVDQALKRPDASPS
jgi:amino acid transporter/ketosteroid isomerase-like protein